MKKTRRVASFEFYVDPAALPEAGALVEGTVKVKLMAEHSKRVYGQNTGALLRAVVTKRTAPHLLTLRIMGKERTFNAASGESTDDPEKVRLSCDINL